MSDTSAVDFITHVFSSIYTLPWARFASYITACIIFPLRIAWVPLSYALSIVNTILAPVGYVGAYLGSWVVAIAGFLVSLEPLYTFFSVAAFIGIVAGVVMAIASAIVTNYFNMNDDQDYFSYPAAGSPSKQQQYLGLDDITKRDPRGLEPDWHWTDPSSSSASRYRRVSGLQTQTIHEEEDSSEH